MFYQRADISALDFLNRFSEVNKDMSELLNQINDDDFEPIVKITDTQGISGEYEFLDIVNHNSVEYAVLCPVDSDGYVDIFRIVNTDGKEKYSRVEDDETLTKVFEIFRMKNEDEFDFM